MEKSIAIIDKNALREMVEEMAMQRFSGKLVNGEAACEILGVSRDTLNRWVRRSLVESIEDEGARRYDLAYLFSLDTKEIRKQYRQLNQ